MKKTITTEDGKITIRGNGRWIPMSIFNLLQFRHQASFPHTRPDLWTKVTYESYIGKLHTKVTDESYIRKLHRKVTYESYIRKLHSSTKENRPQRVCESYL